MDRNPNTAAISANALLAKLSKDLESNESDRKKVEDEAVRNRKASVRVYTFRVMKRAEYEEKKRIADTLAAAADEDVSEEELEALLRFYLKDTQGFNAAVAAAKEIPEEVVPESVPEENQTLSEIAEDKPSEDAQNDADDLSELLETVDENAILPADEPAAAEEAADDLLEMLEDIDENAILPADETAPAEENAEVLTEITENAEEAADDLLEMLEDIDENAILPADEPAPAEENAEVLTEITENAEEAADDLLEMLEDIDENAILPAEENAEVLTEITENVEETLSEAASDAEADISGLEDLLDAIPEDLAEDDAISEEPLTLKDITIPLTEPEAPFAEELPMQTEESDAAAEAEGFADLLSDAEGIAEEITDTDVKETVETEEPEVRTYDILSDSLTGDDEELLGGAFTDADILGDLLAEASAPAEADTEPEQESVTEAEEVPAEEAAPVLTTEDGTKLDATDVDLMIAFGMEDQLEKGASGDDQGKVKKTIGDRKKDHISEMHKTDRPDMVPDPHIEYVSPAQNKEIFSEYKKKYSSVLFRLFGAIILLLLLFFYENALSFGWKMPSVIDPEVYPIVYTLFDLQLVLLLCATVWHGVITGIRSMFRARPIPESITGLSMLVSIVYTTVIAALCPMHSLHLYNFPIALSVFFELCYEFMNLRREIMSFKIVSSKKLKYAVDPIKGDESEAERLLFSQYLSDDPSMFRIKRTAFVEDFFRRIQTYPRTQRILRVIVPITLLLTLGFFAGQMVLSGSVYTSLTTAYIAFLLILPSCAFISFSYPMYRASGFAYEKDSAMIGESSLGELADASVVTFDDKEVFPPQSIRVQNVKVYGNNRIDHVIYAAASVFHAVGGPLAEVFETATGELGYATDVTLVKVDTDGIEARIGDEAVLCGKAQFMNRYGYGVSLSESEKTMSETGDAEMLFIAYENNIAAKLYLSYSVDPDFETVLKQLYRQNVCVGIKTSDPNIDDHLLSCKIRMSKYPIRIIKCSEPKETAIVVDSISSGIVSKSSAKSLLQTLAMCDRVLSASKTNNVIKVVSMVLAAAAMAFFVFSGMAITAAPYWIALYQFFWIIPMILVSRYYI